MTARLSVLRTQVSGFKKDGGNLLAVLPDPETGEDQGFLVLRETAVTVSLEPEPWTPVVWHYQATGI